MLMRTAFEPAILEGPSVTAKEQLAFLEVFETSKPPTPVFCHQEFLEKLAAHGGDAIGRRTAFLMQRLSVDVRRLHYKATQGINRGWRRSRLGGNHGSHFYAWWAPKNALPLKESGKFSGVPDGAVFLRDIRHHDDHSLLPPQSFDAHYMPVTVHDLRREEYAPLPWTQPQVRFASARQAVRLLKGHPGSGKTTALWHAADSTGAERILYVTYSRDLAALAREYFDASAPRTSGSMLSRSRASFGRYLGWIYQSPLRMMQSTALGEIWRLLRAVLASGQIAKRLCTTNSMRIL